MKYYCINTKCKAFNKEVDGDAYINIGCGAIHCEYCGGPTNKYDEDCLDRNLTHITGKIITADADNFKYTDFCTTFNILKYQSIEYYLVDEHSEILTQVAHNTTKVTSIFYNLSSEIDELNYEIPFDIFINNYNGELELWLKMLDIDLDTVDIMINPLNDEYQYHVNLGNYEKFKKSWLLTDLNIYKKENEC